MRPAPAEVAAWQRNQEDLEKCVVWGAVYGAERIIAVGGRGTWAGPAAALISRYAPGILRASIGGRSTMLLRTWHSFCCSGRAGTADQRAPSSVGPLAVCVPAELPPMHLHVLGLSPAHFRLLQQQRDALENTGPTEAASRQARINSFAQQIAGLDEELNEKGRRLAQVGSPWSSCGQCSWSGLHRSPACQR